MNRAFEGKKIILAVPDHAKIYECLEENLTFLGFQVFRVVLSKGFKYKNVFQSAKHIYRKVIFKDRSYKKSLIAAHYDKQMQQILADIEPCDYSLIIRADIFSKHAITQIISLSAKNYAYHWDGLGRYGSVLELIHLFDKFYVFDKNDACISSNKHPLTNFYFDCYPNLQTNDKIEYDAYFIGAHQQARFAVLIELCGALIKNNRLLKIILLAKQNKKWSKYRFISYLKKHISYKQNLEMMSKSKILIDLIDENLHSGLSFRPFEALGYDKKLITNNPIIKEFDFYNPSNIFLYEPDCFDLIAFEQFLDEPYQPIEPSIKQKYSFSHWISYVLETELTNQNS